MKFVREGLKMNRGLLLQWSSKEGSHHLHLLNTKSQWAYLPRHLVHYLDFDWRCFIPLHFYTILYYKTKLRRSLELSCACNAGALLSWNYSKARFWLVTSTWSERFRHVRFVLAATAEHETALELSTVVNRNHFCTTQTNVQISAKSSCTTKTNSCVNETWDPQDVKL